MSDDIDAHVNGFSEWVRANGRGGIEPDVIHTFLQMRDDYLAESGIRKGMLREILLDWFPRKLTAYSEYIAAVAPSISAYIDYLRAVGEGRAADILAGDAEKVLPQFVGAMNDPLRWGMAKSIFSGMADSGVDIQDEAAVESWIRDFNDRAESERHEVLGAPPSMPELPAVRIPHRSELAAAARIADHMITMRNLVDWLGERREITKVGCPRVNDAIELAERLGLIRKQDIAVRELMGGFQKAAEVPGLSTVWNVALAGNVLRTTKTRAYPGSAAGGLHPDAGDDAVLETFENIFDGAIGLESENVGYELGRTIEHAPGVLAAVYIAGLAVLETDAAAEERDAWLESRDPSEAAHEILMSASAGDSVSRLMAMDVLLAIGEPAVDPLKQRLDDPEIWRHAAQILETLDVPSPRRLTEPDRVWMLVEVMSVGMTGDGLDGSALPTDDPAGAAQIFEVMARTGHPAASDVLTRIGQTHPDRQTAKAARKAAFKARSRKPSP